MGSAVSTVPAGPSELLGTSDPSDQDRVRTFTLDELGTYKGTHGKPIYVSLLSDVYDVTANRDFCGPDGKYCHLVGHDASRALALDSNCSDDTESLELKDLKESEIDKLKETVEKLQSDKRMIIVGRLIVSQDLTAEQLLQFDGLCSLRGYIYIALNGSIYDVTANGKEFYGPDGPYHQFAGRDASCALAHMTFDIEYLDNPSIDNLSAEKRTILAEWCTKFQQKYSFVGHLKP